MDSQKESLAREMGDLAWQEHGTADTYVHVEQFETVEGQHIPYPFSGRVRCRTLLKISHRLRICIYLNFPFRPP